jgi:hypothetical protein
MKYRKMLDEYQGLLNEELELRNKIRMFADIYADLEFANYRIAALNNELRSI